MTYLFGPVNSRRLGLSLGLDLLPANICNFDCVYCEVGATRLLTSERQEYTPTTAIIAEIELLLADAASPEPDAFTVTATGEPTLHLGIGAIIRHLKQRTAKPVAVLTNGSLLSQAEVRRDLAAADIVIPSLDAALPRSFRRVNRPAPGLELETIIEGLARFCREFTGQTWLEILLVKGINDSSEDIEALRRALGEVRPQRVQLNTVARPPLEPFAAPLSREELTGMASQLPGRIEILVDGAGQKRNAPRQPSEAEVLEMLRRRPCTLGDICDALHLEPAPAFRVLSRLREQGRLVAVLHNEREYYQVKRNERRSSGCGLKTVSDGLPDMRPALPHHSVGE